MSDELVEAVARALWEYASGPFDENNLSQQGLDALRGEARAAIAVVVDWCADAVNGLAYGDAVNAIRKLGESE